MSFYVKRVKPERPGRIGWTGPIRSPRQAEKERAASGPGRNQRMWVTMRFPTPPVLSDPPDEPDEFGSDDDDEMFQDYHDDE